MIAGMRELLLSDKVTVDLSHDDLINAAKNGNLEKVTELTLAEIDELNEWTFEQAKEFIEGEIDKFEKHMSLALINAARFGHTNVVKFLSSLLNESYTIKAFDQSIIDGDATSVRTLMSLDIVNAYIHKSTTSNYGTNYYAAFVGAAERVDLNMVRELLKNDSIRVLVFKFVTLDIAPPRPIMQSETLADKFMHGMRSMLSKNARAADATNQCKTILDTLAKRYAPLNDMMERKGSHMSALTGIYSLSRCSPLRLDPLFLITKMLLPAKDLNFTKQGNKVSVTDDNIRYLVQSARTVLLNRK